MLFLFSLEILHVDLRLSDDQKLLLQALDLFCSLSTISCVRSYFCLCDGELALITNRDVPCCRYTGDPRLAVGAENPDKVRVLILIVEALCQ